ncbi:hypothetical protein SARC_02279 [Sphaeroforma arctica JP610]|uniref:Uncharacterized protein n=1 Tax=Sphaeroforma arctica JP610 TaxID=667725 RepID=A0A0L0G955_9EUKA|nr:hypothetical protein SARC_02279 [Sphaeroforma arctica JP610]KNC85557.1 hypothetical protein SARC_02279 [Sphaeroforma arctica JP610]|eukprot:XP_014159459.1 hypothetical protein SARC_02279 [Sphaeroforma arctica JP610]
MFKHQDIHPTRTIVHPAPYPLCLPPHPLPRLNPHTVPTLATPTPQRYQAYCTALENSDTPTHKPSGTTPPAIRQYPSCPSATDSGVFDDIALEGSHTHTYIQPTADVIESTASAALPRPDTDTDTTGVARTAEKEIEGSGNTTSGTVSDTRTERLYDTTAEPTGDDRGQGLAPVKRTQSQESMEGESHTPDDTPGHTDMHIPTQAQTQIQTQTQTQSQTQSQTQQQSQAQARVTNAHTHTDTHTPVQAASEKALDQLRHERVHANPSITVDLALSDSEKNPENAADNCGNATDDCGNDTGSCSSGRNERLLGQEAERDPALDFNSGDILLGEPLSDDLLLDAVGETQSYKSLPGRLG